MRQLAWIVCGALVTVLGVSWFASRDQTPSGGRPSVQAAASDRSSRTTARGPEDRSAAGERRAAGSEAAVIADLEARLEGLAPGDAKGAGRNLRRLVRLASPEAIGVAIRFVERSGSGYRDDAERCAVLFAPVRDEQVFLFAERALGRNLAAGRESAEETAGFVRLMARNGGRLGAESLLSLLRGTHAELARAAADAVAIVEDRSLGLDYLGELARDAPFSARESVADGLASWRDARVRKELWRLVSDESIPLEARAAAIGALAAHLVAADVAGFVEAYRSATTIDLRLAFVRSLARVGSRSRLTEDAWRDALAPLVIELFPDGDERLRRAALDAVAARPELRTEDVVAALEARASKLEEDGEDGAGELESVRRLLGEDD